MKPSPFDYHAPDTVAAAVDLLARLEDAKVLAGGQSLVPLLALRLTTFAHLVDLRKIDGLRGIRRQADGLWIGAATTQATAERSTDVAEAAPLLARALPLIGHFQVRNRGTLGGSLAHADPASELPAVAVTLDATLEATSPRGDRVIAAADFFTGTWATALDHDEVLTGVRFPVWNGRCGFAIEEITRRHGDFAIAGACVAVEVDDRAAVRRSAIGLFAMGPIPQRAVAAEQSLAGADATSVDAATLGHTAVAGLDAVPADLNGSAAYRERIGATVVARAWTRAVEEALRG